MKPIIAAQQDDAALQNMGRASLQIIHDIKNQLNGLKLYATFLRKRMEKIDEFAEERETVAKLIAGLDRAAADLTVLVRYCRPMQISSQQRLDLKKVMHGISNSLRETANGDLTGAVIVDSDRETLIGDFDSTSITDALKTISRAALKSRRRADEPLVVKLQEKSIDNKLQALIEWQPVNFENGDPFCSFTGSEAIRMSLAAKIVEAHGGTAEARENLLRVRLPLTASAD